VKEMAGFNAFLKNNNIITGTAIPTEGNFKTGDIIVNVGPNSATEPMWICNEGGNPGVWGPVGVGGGSGSIVSINSSVMIDEPVNEVSLESLGVIVTKKDKLLVHYNSVHLLEGVHFEIAGEGTKIVKLGEGSWNEEGLEDCMFAFELFKGVESIDGNEITVASKMTCKTNHVIIENPCGEVEIGIEGFKSENDTLMVFKNGVIMVEGIDYTIEGDIITSTGEVWNQNGLPEYGITFVVFKEIILYEGDSGTIKMDHLAEDVKEAIENASNIDLSGYQSKEDEELVTNNKTVIGAINELFQSANNGKELIANAIGEPVSADDTFSAMSNDINGLLSTFKTNMMNSGVTVESGDKFKQLIDKLKNISESGNKGIQFTEGSSTLSVSNSYSTENTKVINLDFKPSYVFVWTGVFSVNYTGSVSYNGYSSDIKMAYNNIDNNNSANKFVNTVLTKNNQNQSTNMGFSVYITINNNSFINNYTIYCADNPDIATSTSIPIKYYAIGVGEEDTTLRDSLASILQEEGVSVTEEDDMASLIAKVDSEFDDKNTEIASKVTPAGNAVASNVLSGKTFINSTGQVVTGTMANMSTHTQVADYVAWNTQSIYLGIPAGAYVSTSSTGYPEVYIEKTRLDSNLVPGNIVSGKSICGVNGSATVDSMGGKRIATGTINCSIEVSYSSTKSFTFNYNTTIPFTPSRLILYIPVDNNFAYTRRIVDSVFNNSMNNGDSVSNVIIWINSVTNSTVTISVRNNASNVGSINPRDMVWEFLAIE
jgi:hypothetical protein